MKKEVKHKVTMVYMPFAFCHILNWYEDDNLVESSILTPFELLCFIDIAELANDK